jgi:two-component system, chemotaxis family, response regulator Rcp1
LLIEDSPADVLIIERALQEDGMGHRLSVIPDGRLALDYLRLFKEGSPTSALEPDLILVDLNLPGIDGVQVISEIKADTYLRAIPLVVLTTSGRDEDVVQAYEAGANSYIQKPAEFSNYRDLIAVLRSYWVETALRPPRNRTRPS